MPGNDEAARSPTDVGSWAAPLSGGDEVLFGSLQRTALVAYTVSHAQGDEAEHGEQADCHVARSSVEQLRQAHEQEQRQHHWEDREVMPQLGVGEERSLCTGLDVAHPVDHTERHAQHRAEHQGHGCPLHGVEGAAGWHSLPATRQEDHGVAEQEGVAEHERP